MLENDGQREQTVVLTGSDCDCWAIFIFLFKTYFIYSIKFIYIVPIHNKSHLKTLYTKVQKSNQRQPCTVQFHFISDQLIVIRLIQFILIESSNPPSWASTRRQWRGKRPINGAIKPPAETGSVAICLDQLGVWDDRKGRPANAERD